MSSAKISQTSNLLFIFIHRYIEMKLSIFLLEIVDLLHIIMDITSQPVSSVLLV